MEQHFQLQTIRTSIIKTTTTAIAPIVAAHHALVSNRALHVTPAHNRATLAIHALLCVELSAAFLFVRSEWESLLLQWLPLSSSHQATAVVHLTAKLKKKGGEIPSFDPFYL